MIVWQSTTTGGTAGLILELDSSDGGQLSVETVQKSFRSLIGGLGLRGRTYSLGGVGKQIGVYRLPAAGGTRDLEFRFRPRDNDLHAGDNPLYVCVVQEDGQMAWSSPIYVVV